MNSSSVSIFDFKAVVAQAFGDRPTLREVASKQLLAVLLEQLPWLAFVQPALESADALTLDSPDPDSEYWATSSLVDAVLQAQLDGKPITLEPLGERHYNLGLRAPHRFAGSSSELDTRRLTGGSERINALLDKLARHFYQAQVDYWRAPGSSGQSRDRWLQLLLKMALLRNLPLQGLDDQQQACIRGLIKGGSEQPPVFVVQVSLGLGDQQFKVSQAGLLVTGEWDEREVVLWCEPSSQVRAFESLDDFALALRDELALRFDFDSMTWDRYQLEGDVFAQQSALLLSQMLDDIARLRKEGLTLAQMEQRFAMLSDPSQWFLDGYYVEEDIRMVAPPGIETASAQDNFAYQEALLELALAQAQSDGVSALDGILDLHAYARQNLRRQMLADYPVEANYDPDELIIELAIARGVPGGAGTGSGGGETLEPAPEKTLTEFALGNLVSLDGAVVTGIRHREGQLIMPWMTAQYLVSLIQKVDIGGQYPSYVAQALNDAATRPERTRRLAREWRQSLVFSALSAKLDRKVTQVGLQCVVDFCRGHIDTSPPTITLLPLAFKRQPDSRLIDLARGMYVLSGTEPDVVLLYRPLYDKDPLREYASIDAMMAAIRASEPLQRSILAWMDPSVRHIYDHGGFAEPHISSVGIDAYDLPRKPSPAELAAQLWLTDIDEKLYTANQQLLIDLADWQSVSDEENRWATLSQGAWLLFDVVTLLLSGPVASAAWLVQAIGSLKSDALAFDQGTDEERCAATVDLVLNLGMVLLHGRLPRRTAAKRQSALSAAAFDGAPAQAGGYAAARVVPSQGKVGMPGTLASVVETLQASIDFSWRGAHGFNWLSPHQRSSLMALRSVVSLEGLQASTTGHYEVAGSQYVSMLGECFAVSVQAEGTRVVGPASQPGPWLAFEQGAWRVDARLRLAGGMPKQSLSKRFDDLNTAMDRLTRSANEASEAFNKSAAEVIVQRDKLVKLEALVNTENARRQSAYESDAGDFDWAASDQILSRYQARLAELQAAFKQQRLQSIGHLEVALRDDDQHLQSLKPVLEPKFRSFWRPGYEKVVHERRLALAANMIRSTDFIISELWQIADYHGINDLAKRLEPLAVAEGREPYRQLRRVIAEVVEYEERMLVAHGTLDSLLSEAPRDLNIGLGEQRRSVAQLIAGRLYSIVDLRYHHVLNIVDLALHIDFPQKQGRLARYKAELAGARLGFAAGAHGELLMSSMPVADRIVILQEAWDEYAAAIINSLQIARTGGKLVDTAMLRRYREHLELLKEDASKRLIAAIAEQEGEPGALGEAVYPVPSGVQRAVRNQDGQLVIATEVRETNGSLVLEVRAPVTREVLQVLELKDGGWVERKGQEADPAPLDASAGEADAQVQVLLREHAENLDLARAYVSDRLSGKEVERLLTRQESKLTDAVEMASAQGVSSTVADAVRKALDALPAQREQLLTEAYTNTKYPTAAALRFLHRHKLIKVEYVRRDTSRNTSPFDEFKIIRLKASGVKKEQAIWAAHFHLSSQAAHLQDFTFAHLKLWPKRFQGHAYEVAKGERVHRGPLVREDITGIIPLT